MSDPEALSSRPILVFPIGDFARTVPEIPVGDTESERVALAADLRAELGADVEVSFDEDMYLDGLGAEALCYVVDVWQWIGRAADVVTLAAMGAALLAYLGRLAHRLRATGLDEVDTRKAMPAMGAPVMKLVGAHHAMENDPERAQLLGEWNVQPLLAGLSGDGVAFHAQQLYLVTGLGQFEAFVGVFNAYGAPREMMWVDVYDIKHVGS